MVNKQHYLPDSNNVSDSDTNNPPVTGMKNSFISSSPTGTVDPPPQPSRGLNFTKERQTEQEFLSFPYIHENDDETNPNKKIFKEMGGNELHNQLEQMIQSLPPEKKHHLLYSILQQQQQFFIVNNNDNNNTTDQQLITTNSPSFSSSLDSSNNYLNSELSSSPPKDDQSNHPSTSNHHSNVLMNNRVSNFHSIIPIEELWLRSFSHMNSIITSRQEQEQEQQQQQNESKNWSCCNKFQQQEEYHQGEQPFISLLPVRSILTRSPQYNKNDSQQTSEEIGTMHNSFFPPPTTITTNSSLMRSSSRKRSVDEDNHHQQQQQQITGVDYHITEVNLNEKASPEKGSWANEANCLFDTPADPSKILLPRNRENINSFNNYQRGTMTVNPPSLLSHHLHFNNSNTTSNNLPTQQQEKNILWEQNHFPQCESSSRPVVPLNNTTQNQTVGQPGCSKNDVVNVSIVSARTELSDNSSFHSSPTCPNHNTSSNISSTMGARAKDAHLNLKMVQNQTSVLKPNSSGVVSLVDDNDAILLNKKETQQHSLSQKALLLLGDSQKKNNNTNNSTTHYYSYPVNSENSSFNVPSTNSSSSLPAIPIGEGTTNNTIQQALYFYRNNQQSELEQHSNNNTESIYPTSQHGASPAVMNSNFHLQNSNFVDGGSGGVNYQISSSSQFTQQQQQNYLQNLQQQQPFIIDKVVEANLHPHAQTSNNQLDAPSEYQQHSWSRFHQSQSNQEIEDEGDAYLPKQFAVLSPSSKRRTKRRTEQTCKSTTITNMPSNTVTSLNSNLLKKMTVDMYYDITSAGHPFLPREDLESLSVNDEQRTNLAFMFSLQTLCYQRFGLAKQAHDSFEKAKSLVILNPSDPNLFNTACTYVNLALYCNSSGDPENAKTFSRILDYNILRDDSFRESQNPEQLKALIQMKKISDISGGCGYYGDDRGLNDVSKFILSIYQYSTGGERPVPPEMMQIARQPLNIETLPEYLSLLDCVMKMMLIYESKGLHFSDTQKKLTKYLYYGLSYGMKILLLKLCGMKGQEIEEAAEKITLLCRTPTFTFAPTFLIQPVGLALDIHYEMLKEIDQGERNNIEEFKIAKLLRNDIESLRFLSSRYPELCANFNPTLEQAESLLEQKGRNLSRFLDADVYSSNSGGVTIIEDELKFIEGQIKESAKLKRKSREEEDSQNSNTTPSSIPTATIPNPIDLNSFTNNGHPTMTATITEFPKNNYGVDPLTLLSEEDYELLFGEDYQNSVNHDLNIDY